MQLRLDQKFGGADAHGTAIQRVRGLIRKEFFQILRDPSSLSIAFLMPVVLLLLFGYGVSLDARNVAIGVVVEQPSPEAAGFTDQFGGSDYFDPVFYSNMRPAVQAMITRRIKAIVHLRADFADQLKSSDGARIQVLIDGVDANTARLIAGYVNGVWLTWLERRTSIGDTPVMPVEVRQRIWFNSELHSRNFLVPGLIAIIITLIGSLLTALVMAREWERGTMEAMMVTPVNVREIIIGKLLPYFTLGAASMLLSLSMALFVFNVPLRGSLWVLFAASGLFLLTTLGMGLLISTVTKNQFVAAQMAIIITFLPAFMLSGFIFDIGSMPRLIQLLTYLIAARYFITILQTVFLAGNLWSVIVPNALALAFMAAVLLGLNRRLHRKRLE
jgi:ABC-2 type transport system permease protein